jgi:hypothetical protein
LGRDLADPGIDRIAVLDHGCDQLAGQRRGGRIALDLREMPFEDGLRGPLPELRLEQGREGKAPAGPS